MDFTKITFDEFASKLGKKSATELRSLFVGYGLDLPQSADKDQLLRMAHETLCAGTKSSAPAPAQVDALAAPTSLPSPQPSAGAGRRFRIRARGDLGRWRCAHKFTSAPQEIWESQFTTKEWAQIRADKQLSVSEIE